MIFFSSLKEKSQQVLFRYPKIWMEFKHLLEILKTHAWTTVKNAEFATV